MIILRLAVEAMMWTREARSMGIGDLFCVGKRSRMWSCFARGALFGLDLAGRGRWSRVTCNDGFNLRTMGRPSQAEVYNLLRQRELLFVLILDCGRRPTRCTEEVLEKLWRALLDRRADR